MVRWGVKMPANSFIEVPKDALANPQALQRFLAKVIEQIDIAFGHRGGTPFALKSYVDESFTNNPQSADPGDLDQTISGTYTQAEVQAISDKVDAILAGLRTAKIL